MRELAYENFLNLRFRDWELRLQKNFFFQVNCRRIRRNTGSVGQRVWILDAISLPRCIYNYKFWISFHAWIFESFPLGRERTILAPKIYSSHFAYPIQCTSSITLLFDSAKFQTLLSCALPTPTNPLSIIPFFCFNSRRFALFLLSFHANFSLKFRWRKS